MKYKINIKGVDLTADYNPSFFGNIHIEFRGIKGEENPISKTGYRSQFINGTPESLGITERNVSDEITKLGEKLAEEETALRAKEKRRRPIIS